MINSFLTITAITDINAPIVKLPVSPMNTSAGYTLNHKNPISAPKNAEMNITTSPTFGIYIIFR